MFCRFVSLSLLALAAGKSTLPTSVATGLRGTLDKRSVLIQGGDVGNSSQFAKTQLAANDTQVPAPEARIFFLFLTMSGIERQDLWETFLDKQSPSRWRVLVHCKHTHLCNMQMKANNVLGATQVATVASSYCRDLVSPMAQLLQSALLESTSPRDKFVFLSESTLPVKPFWGVYNTLTWDTNSDFCIYPTDHWTSLQLAGNMQALIVKHSQWVVLNHAHAKIMAANWATINAGLDGPTWSIPVYNAATKAPWGKIANPAGVMPLPLCVDEWAFFATIYGALVDDGRMELTQTDLPGFNAQKLQIRGAPYVTAALQGTCRTFAFWDAADFSGSNLLNAIAHDWPYSRFTCFPKCESTHPAEFGALSDTGVAALRRSRYLFARKFPKNVMTKDQFQRIILADKEPQ